MDYVGKRKLKTHDFQERLEFSNNAGHEGFWDAIYRKAFPDMIFHKLCEGKTQGQYLGIDRVIYLSSGKTLYIEEKKRSQVYPDILLEYISNDSTNTPGWIEKKLIIDYLAYAFLPSKICYLFDWPILRRAWMCFKNEWKSQYPLVVAQNPGYKTLSIPVPIEILSRAISDSRIIQL